MRLNDAEAQVSCLTTRMLANPETRASGSEPHHGLQAASQTIRCYGVTREPILDQQDVCRQLFSGKADLS